jgi:signal transduction histidine kinase
VNLGNLYRYTGEVDEGIRCLNQALVYKEIINDTIGIAITRNIIAIALFNKGEYAKAHDVYVDLQVLYLKNKDIKGLSVVKNYLGLIETMEGNFQQAIKFFKESISINEEIENKTGIAVAKVNIAIPYFKLGNKTKALKELDNGSSLAREIGDLEVIKNSYKNYAEIYYGLGNYKLAYEYKVKYQETQEKHIDNLTRERISSLRINTELEKKKNENEYLETRTKLLEENVVLAEEKVTLQRYFVTSLAIIILLILIPLFVLIRKNKNKLDRNEELVTKNIQLQEANKTRERFLSIIGHDLKNPFNSVLGLTGLLIDEWDALPDSEKLYILNEIHSSSNSIYELMDNLLLWAKNQSGTIKVHAERFNINDSIIEAYEIFRNQATYKEIEIKLNIGSNNHISADPQMINTILRNLFSNALKFTKKNGKILVDLQRLASEIKVSITDNGKGIPPDDLKKILDGRDSFSTKGTADESGTGLGLLVVRDFVKHNKGVFWVESTEGVGSSFCFTLPDS